MWRAFFLAASLIGGAACGSAATGGSSVPPQPRQVDTVLAIANDPSDQDSARVFRWADGTLRGADLPPLGDSLATGITYATPGEAWLSVSIGGEAQLLHSSDDGRTFEPSGVVLPVALGRSSVFHFAPGRIWAARLASVFAGSVGEVDLLTGLWSSSDDGSTWEQRYVFGVFGVNPNDFRFSRRGGRDEAYFVLAGESEPSMLLDLETGERESIETLPFSPTRYVAAGERGFVAGNVPQFPEPASPAIATARRGEAWTLLAVEGAPAPAPFLWVIDFVDELRGVTCGLRREFLESRSVVRGIGCFVTADGGATWDFRVPLEGDDLEVDDVAYAEHGEIVVAARTGVAPGGGQALLLIGREEGGDWQRRTLPGRFPTRLVRSSSATRPAP